MGCRLFPYIGVGVIGVGSRQNKMMNKFMALKNGLLIPMLCVNTYFGAQEVAGKQPVFPATSRKVK
jgi:hypothetical protein